MVQGLLARIRRTAYLVVMGLVLIIYVGLGVLYVQQAPTQKHLLEQIAKLQVVSNKPLASMEQLKADFSAVSESLAPVNIVSVLDLIVQEAEKTGIDIAESSDKFSIPPPNKSVLTKLGTTSLQVTSINGIKVQGSHEAVMAFIKKLNEGSVLPNLILKRVTFEEVAMLDPTEEDARIAEWFVVKDAVALMMSDNKLSMIPKPAWAYAAGRATNNMAQFPDTMSGWAGAEDGKLTDPSGVTYLVGDKGGYLLWGHDVKADARVSDLVNYIKVSSTKYYYTCEANGSVRQFHGPNVATAKEYSTVLPPGFETRVFIDLDLYTKPVETAKGK